MFQFNKFYFRNKNHDDWTEEGEEEKKKPDDMFEILEAQIFEAIVMIVWDKSLALTVVTVRPGSYCCVLRPVLGRSIITGA